MSDFVVAIILIVGLLLLLIVGIIILIVGINIIIVGVNVASAVAFRTPNRPATATPSASLSVLIPASPAASLALNLSIRLKPITTPTRATCVT
jgi:hypothetical protein